MRRTLALVAVLVGLPMIVVGAGAAGTLTASKPVQASANVSPFASCTADNVAGQVGTVYPNTEVEPWVDVNPTNANNIVATWQQDRWSNGGARGLVAGVSTDAGTSWTRVVIPGLSSCSGNTVYKRASDPWLSFAPNGDLYHISLSASAGITFANGFPDSAILVSKSADGGLTWGAPITLKSDVGPNILNDKESITADPNTPSKAYAVWDRIANASGKATPVEIFQHAIGYHGPTWFSRTINGGTSWEDARIIFDPGGDNQTIGNQVVVLPSGDLLDFFDLVYNFKNAGGVRGLNVAFVRSTDQGATWSSAAQIIDKMFRVRVTDPETGALLRTADFNPDFAVDPSNGNLYAVWQDGRFSGGAQSDIAFTMSTDGGVTWSPTVKINANSGGTSAVIPSVHVLADGTVGVSFYDFRNNTPAPGLLTDHWLIHCHPSTADCSSAASWTDETRVTRKSFDYLKAPNASGRMIGDYVGLASTGDAFAALFTQTSAAVNSSDAFYSSVGP